MNEDKNELEYQLATVAEITATGLKLIFDGEADSDGKVYACNAGYVYAVGDRVKVCKISGTYLVEYVIGPPPTTKDAGKLVNGDYSVLLSSNGFLYSQNVVNLGASNYPFEGLYANGNIHLGSSRATVGFFGVTGTGRQSLSTSGNNQGYSTITSSNITSTGVYALNNVIGILKKLGLLS